MSTCMEVNTEINFPLRLLKCSPAELSLCQRSLQPLFWPVTTPLIPLCFLSRPRQSSQLASVLLSCMSLCQERGKRGESQGSFKNNNRGFPVSCSVVWEQPIFNLHWKSVEGEVVVEEVFAAFFSLLLVELGTNYQFHFIVKYNKMQEVPLIRLLQMSALEMDDIMELSVWIVNEVSLTHCIQLKWIMLDLQVSVFIHQIWIYFYIVWVKVII